MKGIVCTPWQIRKIKDGGKTSLRFPLLQQPELNEKTNEWRWKTLKWTDDGSGVPQNVAEAMAPFCVGDTIFVKEAFYKDAGRILYRADFPEGKGTIEYSGGREVPIRWNSSMTMTKEEARLFMTVSDVRIERLQDITESEAIQEGVVGTYPPSKRHKDNQDRWVRGHCSECTHFNLQTRMFEAHCEYEGQKPRGDWGSYIGCNLGFELKKDNVEEPPIFLFWRLWDRDEHLRDRRGNCFFWADNPWVVGAIVDSVNTNGK